MRYYKDWSDINNYRPKMLEYEYLNNATTLTQLNSCGTSGGGGTTASEVDCE